MSTLLDQHVRDRGRACAAEAPHRRLTLRTLLGLRRYLALRLRYPHLGVGLFFMDRGADIRVERDAQVHFGRGVRFMGNLSAHFAGVVAIGDDVFFNRGCHIVALNSITIGDHCLFGEYVSIHDENHVPGSGSESIAARGFTTAPIVIGNNVWVGAKATILKGVTIGDNAVIGANAVVTRDVPAGVIVGGIPARVIRKL